MVSYPQEFSFKFQWKRKEENNSAMFAYELVNRIYSDENFNQTYGLFFNTQPAVDELLTIELLPEELLDEIQIPYLQQILYNAHMDIVDFYYGETGDPNFKSIPELVGDFSDNHLSLEMFLRYSALISSRAFEYNDTLTLAPVLDMFNHADRPNTKAGSNSTHKLLVATKYIKAGEEITIQYKSNILHRNDMSFFFYGRNIFQSTI